jgi:hypothetical protein
MIIMLCLYFGFDELIQSSVIHRTLEDGSGGRYEKLQLIYLLVSQDWNILLGVPLDLQNTARINGVGFSDNSFGLLLMNVGVSALIFFGLLLSVIIRFLRITHTKLPVFVGVCCLITTNSILWEPWIFYYLIAMTLIYDSMKGDRHRFFVLPQKRLNVLVENRVV